VCNTPSQVLKSLQGLRGQMGMYLRCKLPEVWVATNSPATDIVRSSERAAIVDKVDAMLKARIPAPAAHLRSLRAFSSVRGFCLAFNRYRLRHAKTQAAAQIL
jgi:hypothetical protein